MHVGQGGHSRVAAGCITSRSTEGEIRNQEKNSKGRQERRGNGYLGKAQYKRTDTFLNV